MESMKWAKFRKILIKRNKSKKNRQRVSLAQKGLKNHRFGKINSKETNRKISLSLMGRKFTESHKTRIKKSLTGLKRTKENIENWKKASKGKFFGENNNAWKGGKITTTLGYIKLYTPNHPRALNNYVFEHRLVVEKHIGRLLSIKEPVHHVDFNKINNNIKNLIVFKSSSSHQRFHQNPLKVKSKEIIFDGRIINE